MAQLTAAVLASSGMLGTKFELEPFHYDSYIHDYHFDGSIKKRRKYMI